VALNLRYRIFLNFAESCILSCLSKFDIERIFHRAVFENALKADIEGILTGNILCDENDNNVLTNDSAVF